MDRQPKLIILILIGAFLAGSGIVLGFALGRRTVFFASVIPPATPVELSLEAPAGDQTLIGEIIERTDTTLVVKTGGEQAVVTLTAETEIIIANPQSPVELARSLEVYRARLKQGDLTREAPTGVQLVAGTRDDLVPGKRVRVSVSGGKSQKIIVQ